MFHAGSRVTSVLAAYSVHVQSTIPNATLTCDELPFMRVADAGVELAVEKGYFIVPEQPGLGMKLDMKVVKKYRVG